MKLLAGPIRKAAAAADSLTGKRFSLLVASSLVATTGIVAVGLSSAGGMSPLEATAAKALLEEEGAAIAAAPAPSPETGSASSPEPASSAGAASSGVLPAPAPAPEPAPAATQMSLPSAAIACC